MKDAPSAKCYTPGHYVSMAPKYWRAQPVQQQHPETIALIPPVTFLFWRSLFSRARQAGE